MLSLTRAVKEMRKEAITFGLQWVESTIVRHALKMGFKCLSSWKSISNCWKGNKSGSFSPYLFELLYTQFDKQPGWENNLEDNYMELKKYKYKHQDKPMKGSFARVFRWCLNLRIKNIRDLGTKHHGNEIRKKRFTDEITEKTKYKKRKQGETLGCFAVIAGERKYNPTFGLLLATEVSGKFAAMFFMTNLTFWFCSR